jgi:hypothetical protein
MYRGYFTVRAGEGTPDRDIRLSWLPTPRIEVNGEHSTEPGHIEAFLVVEFYPVTHMPHKTGQPRNAPKPCSGRAISKRPVSQGTPKYAVGLVDCTATNRPTPQHSHGEQY